MSSESLRAFLTVKSRECGASWEKESMGFFKQIYAEGEQKEGGRRNKNQPKRQPCMMQHQKKREENKTNRQKYLSTIYICLHTRK